MKTEHTPALSIIILTRNRATLLTKNLSSLAGQLHPNDEIVLIDNGSTDETRDVLRSFQKSLPIRIHRLPHGSYPTLYNAGIRFATGDIVVFLDDDCIAHTSFVSRIRAAHKKHGHAVIQGVTYSIPRGNIYADIMGDHYRSFLRTNIMKRNTLRVLDNKNASIPRSLILTAGGFDERLVRGSEDIELGIRLRSLGVPIILSRSVIVYHHERTTFGAFAAQHLRFARSEGYLDTLLPGEERMGLIRRRKLFMQLASAIRREWKYLRGGKLKEAVLLPILYLTLACLRIWGYATNR